MIRSNRRRGFSEKVTLLKASIYESEEEYDLALVELKKVMVLFPEAIQFRIVAAELCMKSGKEDEAAQFYLEMLDGGQHQYFCPHESDRLLQEKGGLQE